MRHRTPLLALLAVVAVIASACGTATTELSDPKEIVTKAVEKLQAAKSLHLVVTVDGELSLDLFGSGSAAPVSLTGTKIEGDIDITNQAVSLELAVPALLGLTGEIIVTDGFSYTKTSLTGEKYQKSAVEDALPDPAATDGMIAELRAFLDRPEVDPKKGADVDCDGKKCYSVTIELTAEEIAAFASGAPDALPSLPVETGAVTITLTVDKASLRFSAVTATVAVEDSGSLTLAIGLSKWDEAVSISAPPADQIGEGGGLFN